MGGRRARAAAVTGNTALFGLTRFAVSRPEIELEGMSVLLFVLVIVAPILSLVAMYGPTQLPSIAPSTGAATEGHA